MTNLNLSKKCKRLLKFTFIKELVMFKKDFTHFVPQIDFYAKILGLSFIKSMTVNYKKEIELFKNCYATILF